MNTKECTRCRQVKNEDDFEIKGGGRPGRHTQCRGCRSASRKKAPRATQMRRPPQNENALNKLFMDFQRDTARCGDVGNLVAMT